MTSTIAPKTRLDVERSPLTADAKVVLDYLCRRPAAILDFADIADDMQLPRARVEEAVSMLRHQRYGPILSSFAPWGEMLPTRRAYLAPDAKIRGDYPTLEHKPIERPRAHVVQKPSPTDARNAAAKKNAEEVRQARLADKQRRLDASDLILANIKAEEERRAARKAENLAAQAKVVADLRAAQTQAQKPDDFSVPKPEPKKEVTRGR